MGLNTEITSARAKARDTLTLRVTMTNGLIAQDLPEGSLLKFVVKSGVANTATTYAMVETWTKPEDTTGLYVAKLSLNTSPLITAIANLDSIGAVAELTWSEDDGETWESSNTLVFTIGNDVYKGTEGTPLELPNAEEWLQARRPAVILRTALQGPPVNQVIGNGETYHLDLSGVIIDVAGNASFTVETVLNDTYTVALLATDPSNHLVASKIAAVLNADETFASVLEAEADEDILIIRYLSTDAPGLAAYFELAPAAGGTLVFDGGPYEFVDPVHAEAVAAVAGTQALAIGAECRVGDAIPYRWFKAAEINPTRWQETTPALIENRDTEAMERLFVADSTLQTELLS